MAEAVLGDLQQMLSQKTGGLSPCYFLQLAQHRHPPGMCPAAIPKTRLAARIPAPSATETISCRLQTGQSRERTASVLPQRRRGNHYRSYHLAVRSRSWHRGRRPPPSWNFKSSSFCSEKVEALSLYLDQISPSDWEVKSPSAGRHQKDHYHDLPIDSNSKAPFPFLVISWDFWIDYSANYPPYHPEI